MKRREAPSRSATSEKVNTKGQFDANKERLMFVLTSLVGQRVTARLRDNEIYEGLFHGFSPDPDFAITLKSARKLASERNQSGKVHEALIISGKDFLQVSALDVPSTTSWDNNEHEVSHSATGFRTDGEISQNKSTERELVPWSGGADVPEVQGGLQEMRHNANWDQFATNLDQFGVTTTFNEELYTTKLDPNSIPAEKRAEADRLAREIEAGQMSADVERNIDGEDDEEGRFSAVQGTGAYDTKKSGQSGWGNSEALVAGSSSTASSKAGGKNCRNQGPLSQIPPMPEDRHRQDDTPSAKRLGANSPAMMKTSMISEMKRINALNLEPAVPKLEDKGGSDWMTYQQSQPRNAQKSAAGANDLKMNFQQSLDLIHKREASKQQNQAKLQQEQGRNQDNSSSDNWRSNAKGGGQLSLPTQAMAQGGEIQRTVSGSGGDSNKSKFTFNASAATFTPGGSNSGSGQNSMQPQQSSGGQMSATPKATASSPPFNIYPTNSDLLNKKLETILDSFFECSRLETLDRLEPQWTEAQGPSYKDVLGQPVSLPNNGGNMGPAQPMAMGAPWQQPHQQQQPMGQGPPGGPPQGGGQGGNASQMMQQPVMFQAPGGQNQPMFQPMFQPGPNASMPPQRPQNAGNMPAPQDQQPMGDGNPHNMGWQAKQQPQGGQFMVSAPGGPGGQGGMMMMMVPGQGGPMPKYGQVMMAPGGQFPQFPQGGGQPGGPGPGHGGNPHGGQWQQVANAHMVPGHMMQQQQVGPRGPPHQMGGHEG